MDDYLATVGNIFRKNYLRDLIVRHTAAPSSRQVRNAGHQPQPEVQFNTLKLTRTPLKKGKVRYASKLNLRGKTVLVFDDFCTNGMTFEAARHLLKQAGAETIQVSWLKTINRGYRVIADLPRFSPYDAVVHDAASIRSTELPYSRFIVGPQARTELSEAFEHYQNWTSPV
jgi:hypoxanthine phosphoribosyltransferase